LVAVIISNLLSPTTIAIRKVQVLLFKKSKSEKRGKLAFSYGWPGCVVSAPSADAVVVVFEALSQSHIHICSALSQSHIHICSALLLSLWVSLFCQMSSQPRNG
jgi:hypothetical protein